MTTETFDFTPQPMHTKSDFMPEDTYVLRLKEIGEKRKEMNNFSGEEEAVQEYILEVAEGEYKGKIHSYKVNPNINFGYLEGAKKSRLYKLHNALLGVAPETVGGYTSSDLLGRTCKATMVEKVSAKGNSYNQIAAFMADRKQSPFNPKNRVANDDPPIVKPEKEKPLF